MPDFKYDGYTIAYDDFGKGIAVVFIHPPGMGRRVFIYQEPLSAQYRLLIPDLSGHGDSSISYEPVTIERYAAEIKALLDHTGVQQAVICGYSAGGSVAQAFALTYPERTRALMLSGGYPKVATKLLEWEYKAGMKFIYAKPDVMIRGLARAHFLDTNVQQMIMGHMGKADLNSWYQFYKISAEFDCSREIEKLTIPLHLVYGTRVFWINSHSKFYHACENARLTHIEKATHQIPTKHWHTFNHHLSDFIKSTI
ncbi:alpha/beta fold hydrolase [Thalassobacillus pellis]|uniref:alpha/beta fold hydrolase n=1 Tax=Thalassobacillus pellis TaxID=748008 RepID=UPI00195FD8B3|nr:alpha/beta hydrolase [Thalassobacillus pellis]MBM7554239.1 pimeloyl-ACP methyl ester carboxylesterase [Thalassobacillus pellis]